MALDKAQLKGRIKANMIAHGAREGQHSWLDVFCQAVADAVVDELTANAEVTVSVAGGSSAGDHPGIVE